MSVQLFYQTASTLVPREFGEFLLANERYQRLLLREHECTDEAMRAALNEERWQLHRHVSRLETRAIKAWQRERAPQTGVAERGQEKLP